MKANKFERRVQHLSQTLAELMRKMEKAGDEAFKLVDEGEAFQALLRARALGTQVMTTRHDLVEAYKAWRPMRYSSPLDAYYYLHQGEYYDSPGPDQTRNLDLQSLSHGELGLLLRKGRRAKVAAERVFGRVGRRNEEAMIAAAPAELERRRAERKSAREIKD